MGKYRDAISEYYQQLWGANQTVDMCLEHPFTGMDKEQLAYENGRASAFSVALQLLVNVLDRYEHTGDPETYKQLLPKLWVK